MCSRAIPPPVSLPPACLAVQNCIRFNEKPPECAFVTLGCGRSWISRCGLFLGVARVGGVGEHSSGDLFVAFSTANRGAIPQEFGGASPLTSQVTVYSNANINQLFDGVVEATEEAILNALLAAETMTGRDDIVAYRLEPRRLAECLGIDFPK
jgi:hypothetical protein